MMKLKTTPFSANRANIAGLILFMGFLAFTISQWWPKPTSDEFSYRIASFLELPGWGTSDMQKSLTTFQISCKSFLRMPPEHLVGSQHISMQAKDWYPACKAAMEVKLDDPKAAQGFFEQWFVPIEWYDNKPVSGLFTGYYLPYYPGSLTQTSEYNVPIYGTPTDLMTVHLTDFDPNLPPRRLVGRMLEDKFVPYPEREAINAGYLQDKAPVLVWVKSHIDRLYLGIQGSGVIEIGNGKIMHLGYAAQNGGAYTPIGKILIEKGALAPETVSMQSIRSYLESHPDEILPVINQNKSFVFFKILNDSVALGAQGVALTSGYSLAVDRKWIPLGTPLWLNTTVPSQTTTDPIPFQRLMIAQDTGGAIRGAVRGDVFWGGGDKATYIAGKMKNAGHYWLLLPRDTISRLPKTFAKRD